jgi:low affinity Fe/Cu permease
MSDSDARRHTLFTGRTSGSAFEHLSHRVTHATGSPFAFVIAAVFIVGWAVAGPLFDFSNRWQLVVNTATTIVTFLMVFVIQQSQNKDTIAIQLKLNELIAATQGASNRLIDIEDLSEKELEVVKQFYVRLAARTREENDITRTHSLDEEDDRADRPADRGAKPGK